MKKRSSRILRCVSVVAGFAWAAVLSATPEPADGAHLLLDSGSRASTEVMPPNPPSRSDELKSLGYTGRIAGSIEGIPTFSSLAPGAFPATDAETAWLRQNLERTRRVIADSHRAGLRCYASTDLLVIPKAVLEHLRPELCDEHGRIDILRPRTQDLFRALLRESFAAFPDLDGIVVRTGEVYLHDFPYHTAGGEPEAAAKKIQGNTAILHGPDSHIAFLKILREEVCEKLGKTVIYRTWDFGNFHEKTAYYLQVTNAIEPHPNLIFSVKHQKGDFHQLTVFNPTLMIGRHRQIIEVQAQREAYGKGAHPYYIGQGVIEGWEEYAWLMKPGQPKGLRDVIHDPLCLGVWTWSRGGGWDGPAITDGLWCDLNAYVVSEFARNPAQTEPEIFERYTRGLGLKGDDLPRFRELALLSARAVLRGQLTTLGAKINVWWARDDTLKDPDLRDFVDKGLVEKAITEKADSVALWRRMESLARELNPTDPARREFIVTSTTYGRIKYELIAEAWTAILLGRQGEKTGTYDRPRIDAAIAAYDRLWTEWRQLQADHPSASAPYRDVGLGQAVNRYRTRAATP